MASSHKVDTENDFPSEIKDTLANFDDALSQIEEILKVLHQISINDIHQEMSSLDKAKLELMGAYSMNSLFWMYLTTRGQNAKDHGIKRELNRIRSYMARVKEIEDKAKAPKINKDATKRFVRSALWQQAQQKAPVEEVPEPSTPDNKRNHSQDTSSEESNSKQRKKKNKNK